ncbi:MAG: hypothetical protein ABIJ20_01215 [Nanoarchaeota archaeon]|nr:hypothetical protein [Nanoarchaeota archaeon]MBU1444984.1 hypothetical protein [Nanoarchaeota archaeon]MBU2406848.1 hypothetical protein [Nanoarchaeota archaeon]MBU2420840.1 hypothetical protein [Nanoarchaeota archaeon]MBU2475816.1 hypothetical protein [Nanoarchaeota archaeon]
MGRYETFVLDGPRETVEKHYREGKVWRRVEEGFALLATGDTPVEDLDVAEMERMGFTYEDTDVDPEDFYNPNWRDLWRHADSETDFFGEFSSPEFIEAGLVKKRRVRTKVTVTEKRKKNWMSNFGFGSKRDAVLAGEHDVDLGHEVSLGIDRTVGEGLESGHKIISGGTLPYQRRGRRLDDD